jgi:streptogramin lyase
VTRVISSVVSDQTDGPERELRLAVDGQNNLYVLSRYSYAIFKFSPQGRFVSRFGSRGNQPDQFGVVYAIAIDSEGRVYIGDSNSIKVFDPSGRFRNSFAAGSSAYSIAFDDQDALWVTDGNKVSKFVLHEP